MSTPTKPTTYWRSLDELQQSPEFEEFLRREFPVGASEYPRGVSRRRWLQLMGASFALAGLTGCHRWDAEELAPFAARPENRIPGKPVQYATSVELAGKVEHLLVSNYDGRPIKVEGNPDHPDGGGATSLFAQALLLELYDPDRSQTPRQRLGKESFARSWSDFDNFAGKHFAALRERRGQGLAILVEPSSSLSWSAALQRLQDSYTEAQIFQYASLGEENVQLGTQAAYGFSYRTHLHLDRARVIAAFDADLLHDHPAALRHARDYVVGRDPNAGSMSRLYAVESQFSLTGAAADHRWPIPSSQIGSFLDHLEDQLRVGLAALSSRDAAPMHDTTEGPTKDEAGLEGASATATGPGLPAIETESPEEKRIRVLASDLLANRGAGIIAAGNRQPAAVHAQIHRLNVLLGNAGKTIEYTAETHVSPPSGSIEFGRLEELARQIQAGEVRTLVLLGGNPAFDAPADLRFDELIRQVPETIRLGLYEDETSLACRWHLPAAHPLESWGDAVSHHGRISVTQPMIEPLFQGRSPLELLTKWIEENPTPPANLVRNAISNRLVVAGAHSEPLGDLDWKRLLHDGFLPESLRTSIKPDDLRTRLRTAEETSDLLASLGMRRSDRKAAEVSSRAGVWEVVFTAGETVYDGRFANNGWLQETPDFLTKLTWDNAAVIHPESAREIGVRQGELIRVTLGGETVETPVYLLPGQARGSIGLALGYGRTAAGHVGGLVAEGVDPVGVDVNRLRTWASRQFSVGARVEPTGKTYPLATTQDHHAIDTLGLAEIGQRVGDLVREGPLGLYLEHPDFASHPPGKHHPPLESLWQEPSYEGRAWGMGIDLNKCIGCNACMVACQAENNVPVVGKEQVLIGREMHWIRVDRYFRGDLDEPQVVTQPVACQQCENAPCEQVCPVAATVHSDEGLNDMVYNRCIGTRYCANNCPYKVRRFNYFDYNQQLTDANRQLTQLVINPEVTVRSRGVMEKCTYCVQRIQVGKIAAKNDRRPLDDGEIVTACQQACPTRAIEFGDLNLPESRVSQAHADPRAYAMLSELNVKPRTKYLARIRNPHPELAEIDHHTAHEPDHATGGT
jgi:MoCo/4Fe-4S cofactor protein with predicted Tat translocation signal